MRFADSPSRGQVFPGYIKGVYVEIPMDAPAASEPNLWLIYLEPVKKMYNGPGS